MASIFSFFVKKKRHDIEYLYVPEVGSTNNELLRLSDAEKQDGQAMITVLRTDYQSCGRGQGTNQWESERGKNLLFSMRCHPVWLPLRSQFLISEANALALIDTLDTIADGFSIKWPNDIYYNHSKVAGTLIENKLARGHLKDCIIGTGLNVNQCVFESDAPNPISLKQITGKDYDPELLMKNIAERFKYYLQIMENGDYATIVTLYMSRLYRLNGFHKYRDADGVFMGALVEVEDDGHLILRDDRGKVRSYAFKEIEFVLEDAV